METIDDTLPGSVFPNPQDNLPLPPRPHLEQYTKLAKDLVKACKGGDLHAWAVRLSKKRVRAVEQFAERVMLEKGKCTLTSAQFVIAKCYGFLSWPDFAKHLEEIGHDSATARFEAAADAIVNGDITTVKKLLAKDPDLIRARSLREHRSTLLHYTSANGVEGYRQKTPQNIVEIAQLLLDAGAEVDAKADMYGGDCTTLGLAATSVHPEVAGVQIPLLQLLLDRGAVMDLISAAGRTDSIVFACLANGRPKAAAFLADRGARLDFVTAAALGRIAEVKNVSNAELNKALFWACEYADVKTIRLMVEAGAEVGPHRPDSQSPLHMAVIGGNVDVVKYLLQFHPPLEAKNEYGGTVLGQAVWSAAHGGDPHEYAAIIETLIGAGAQVRPKHPPVNPRIDAVLRRFGSQVEPSWTWQSDEEA